MVVARYIKIEVELVFTKGILLSYCYFEDHDDNVVPFKCKKTSSDRVYATYKTKGPFCT